MSKVLLDSDILIDILRGKENVRQFVLDVAGHAVPCCSVISVAEIYAGMRPEESQITARLLEGLLIVDVTRRIAEMAGLFKQRTKSPRLELADSLIAAAAVVEGASLATGNAKDYPMPELALLPFRR